MHQILQTETDIFQTHRPLRADGIGIKANAVIPDLDPDLVLVLTLKKMKWYMFAAIISAAVALTFAAQLFMPSAMVAMK